MNKQCRDGLSSLLFHVEFEMEKACPSHKDHAISRREHASHTSLLGRIILRTYEHVPDKYAISLVKQIAETRADWVPTEWHSMIDAAKHCLPILTENVRRAKGSTELLRASELARAGSGGLLRPRTDDSEAVADELLRPHNDGEDTGVLR